jgi:nucleoid DNA-binding protein
MTKAGLIHDLYEQHGALTRTEAGVAIEAILDIMKSRVARGQRILVTNFGSFEVLARKVRRGRNPVTGEIIAICPRRTLVFRTARRLEEALNGNGDSAG